MTYEKSPLANTFEIAKYYKYLTSGKILEMGFITITNKALSLFPYFPEKGKFSQFIEEVNEEGGKLTFYQGKIEDHLWDNALETFEGIHLRYEPIILLNLNNHQS